MAKKSLGARIAMGLAHAAAGIGGGYGKGSLEVALRQRQEALDEIKAQRADRASKEEMAWRAAEAEKIRTDRKAEFAETKEWDKEKFGLQTQWDKEKFAMQEAGDERQAGRSLAAQITLEKMRQKAGKDTPADIQKSEYYAKILAEESGSETVTAAHKKAAFEKLNQERAASTTDPRTGLEREAEVLENTRAAAEGRAPTPQGKLKALEELKNVGAYEPKTAASGGVTIPQYMGMVDKAADVVDPDETRRIGGETSAVMQEAEEYLRKKGVPNPLAGEAAEPAPAAGDKGPAPSAAEDEQDALAGIGTQEDPYVATSVEELERLYNEAKAGTTVFVRYKNQLRQLEK